MSGPEEVVLDTPEQDALLGRLRAVAAEADPVPAHVRTLASAAFSLRDLDAELAVLVHDSAGASPELSGVRGDDDARLLSYDAEAVGVELQVVTRRDRRDVLGQVVGDPPAALAVETGDGEHPVVPDATGVFRLADLAAGRLRIRVTTAGGLTVLTPWTVL